MEDLERVLEERDETIGKQSGRLRRKERYEKEQLLQMF